jgi:FO synthase
MGIQNPIKTDTRQWYGGVLMNESITCAAGATHGQQMTESSLVKMILGAGRRPVQRNTLYEGRIQFSA